jgi:xanthine/CO dehydrogenase XdhC/CoxF family maturation factor
MGVAARVEGMAAVKLENGGGVAAALGKREEGKWGGVAAKGERGGGGGCPQGGLRERAARVLGGGEWASHRRIVINGPKPFLR